MTENSAIKYVGPLLLAAVVVTAAGGTVDGANAGGNAESPTKISSCTEITEPGSYVLTKDLESDGEPCLVIDSDGVSLDGQNHSVVQNDDSSPVVGIRGTDIGVRDVFVTGGVEYRSGSGSVSRTTGSGGELFVDAERENGGTSVTVRVSDGFGSSSSSQSSSSSSVSMSSSSSSSSPSLDLSPSTLATSSVSAAIPDELLGDGELPPICGFESTDERRG